MNRAITSKENMMSRQAWMSKLQEELKQTDKKAIVRDATDTTQQEVDNPLGLAGHVGDVVFVHPVYPDGYIVAAVQHLKTSDL